MKCQVHGTEMEYTGEDPFGHDVWYCEVCHAEEEAEFQRTTEDYAPEPDFDGGECPHCRSTYTMRIDTILDDPVVWACECYTCGTSFEMTIPQSD